MKTLRKVDVVNLSELVEFDFARLRKLVRTLDEFLPSQMRTPEGDLSIAVMDDAKLCEIHQDFLNDPTKTDVITFEGDKDENFAGEICVSAERAIDVCKNFSNTPNLELALYVAHGMLHLAGIDDIEPEDAAKMREAEAVALEIIKKKFKKPIFNFKKI